MLQCTCIRDCQVCGFLTVSDEWANLFGKCLQMSAVYLRTSSLGNSRSRGTVVGLRRYGCGTSRPLLCVLLSGRSMRRPASSTRTWTRRLTSSSEPSWTRKSRVSEISGARLVNTARSSAVFVLQIFLSAQDLKPAVLLRLFLSTF